MTKNKYSTGHLDRLWRQAILKKYNHKCACCGKYGDENLQIHHIVRRKHAVLKHHHLNGIPGCIECHRFYHTKNGEIWLSENVKEYKFLCATENVKLKDLLVQSGMTRAEFSCIRKNELQEIIDAK